ncbi:MAG: twin-arginine translocation signal domain-containing protein, partial [Candidatus Hydrogenedentes bacterium]|nr:twin-arginine translocation signal domain-containing protein [Candidatus Hydrogenedentota bacterium]
MNAIGPDSPWTRRDFIKTSAVAAGAAATRHIEEAVAENTAPAQKVIGIQAGAVSFVDEGVDRVLDVFQEKGSVNTIFLATFTYGRGIGGRQVPGQPLPDHGKQEYDPDFHGGNFATPHRQFYAGTVLQDTRAPDHGKLDIIDHVLDKAHRRDMKVYCWYEDVFSGAVPNIQKLTEVDLYGRKARTLCPYNPDYRSFLIGLTEDYCKSYDIDGVMWGCERQGPLNNALGSRHGGKPDPTKVTCFCEHCQNEAMQRGINIDRARKGYEALAGFVTQALAGTRPNDGYFVAFWRLLLDYP